MKTIRSIFITASIMLGSSVLLGAIPSLDEGDSYIYHHVKFDEGSFKPSPNPTNGIDWQFQLDADSMPIQLQVSPAISHPDHANFPSAELVIVNDFLSSYDMGVQNYNFHFISSSNNRQVRYGRVDVDPINEDRHINIFNNPEEVIRFPLVEGLPYSDHWSGSYFDPSQNAYVYWSNGLTEYQADQVGTMKLNGKVLENVTRVKRIRKYSENTNTGIFKQRYATYYEWYNEDFPFPLVTMILKKGFNGDADIMEGYFIDASHLTNVGLGTEPVIETAISLYPNPSDGVFNLSFDLEKDSPVQISVYNGSGQLIKILKSDDLPSGSYTFKYNLDLPRDVYILNLNIAGTMRYEKLVVR